MESVVTIPYEFEELPEECRRSIVPICIGRRDAEGNEIAWGWFDAVVPIQDSLRGLARRRLRDVWRVSELTELSVHGLWRKHRDDLGAFPSRRIYRRAMWDVEDLRANGWRNRRCPDVALDGLQEAIREVWQRDRTNYEEAYQIRLRIDAVDKWLKQQGREDVREILDLMARGHKWAEISDHFGQTEESLRRRFSRWMKRLRASI
jgi:hypothetical protein